jgi:peptidoglycan/LPS O-acetylase OafA/YrhL
LQTRVQDLRPLTSLRFFAAFAIVLLHAKLYTKWHWLELFTLPLVHGVSFFFVLSGFILTHVYSARGGISHLGFIRLRIARLWPVHLITLLMVILFINPVTFAGTGLFDRRLTLLANLLLIHAVYPFPSYLFAWNSVSWSISTEMFFYISFPSLLPRIQRFWPAILSTLLMLTVAVFGILQLASVPLGSEDSNQFTISSATYANPLTRIFEFSLGMATWVLWDRHLRKNNYPATVWSIIELTTIAIAALWLIVLFEPTLARFPWPWLSLWFGVSGSCWLFALMIFVFAGGRGAIGRLLSRSPLVWMGEISFAIYMVHQILFKILNWNLGLESELVFFPALIAASAALHHLIEKPGRTFLTGSMFALRPVNATVQGR